jgi:hypothetical protein
MMEMIVAAIEAFFDFTFDDFAVMAEQLRAPYRMEIEGHMVTVTENEKAVMMEGSALEVIKTTILGEKCDFEEGENVANKKARTNTTAGTTGKGQNGLGAVQFTDGRMFAKTRKLPAKKSHH